MEEKKRVVIIAPTRSTCLNISMTLNNGAIETLLIQEKRKEIFEAVDRLDTGGFGVVAGTGTGKTVSLRDIARKVLGEKLQIDVVTREHEATSYTWTCNVLVITPGVALHWLKSQTITKEDLIVIDEIHQTSEHLEFSMALAKRAGCKFVWMSATIDPSIYSEYLGAGTVIECSAFDPSKRSEVECSWERPEDFLSSRVSEFIEEGRAVAVFVPTREMAERLSQKYGGYDNLYCDFYHGGEKAEKLRQFLKGDVTKPFMVFMTIAGASSLNIPGLDTVIIVDEMYKEIVHSGVRVLEKVQLGNNELLQMGGRVNGRMEDSEIYILGPRSIGFHNLKPTAPEFVLGDLQQVALTCARLGVNAGELDLITPIDPIRYEAEVNRFKARGIIEAEGNELTAYGKKVERLPVEPSWAELITQARDGDSQELLDIAVIGACTESLYSLIRNNANLSEAKVSGSDQLTAYNIVAAALNQFGFFRKSNGGGVEYAFQGDWFRKKFNPKTHQTEKNMGEFVRWCDDNGFNPKAIKEVAIAMKSVYRQLRMSMPGPQNLQLVSEDDEMHRKFVDLFAKVQSLDFVCDERNSQAGTVWRANHSLTSGTRVLGKIRHWADKRGYQRATIEGTEVPEDLLKLYADKRPVSVKRVSNEGVEIEFESSFAGEPIGMLVETVPDSEVPAELVEQAERKFVKALVSQQISADFADHNRETRKQSSQLRLRIRSGGAAAAQEISKSDERKLYEQEFKDKEIISIQSLQLAILSGEINPNDLLLKLEDFVPVEEQERIVRDNPDTVEVGGETLTVEYGEGWRMREFYCHVKVTEEFARSAGIEAITLPGGRTVELRCGDHSAESFFELVEKLEQERIEQAWSDKRAELEHTSWISDPENVFPYLPKILTAVEITRKDNGQGEPVVGYFSLYSDSDPDFQIRLRETEEDAEKETKTALERLFQKATREERKAPSEEPWNRELREVLKNRLDALLKERAENLVPENMKEQIKAIEVEIKAAKAEIGNKHAEIQQLVAETDSTVYDKVEAVDNEFVESEVSQTRAALDKARDYLKFAAYEDAKAACKTALEFADQLARLAEIRSVVKREAEAVREEVSNNLYDLKYGDGDYDDSTSDERAEADRLDEEISDAFYDRQYETAIKKVEEARKLIARVRERQKRKADLADPVARLFRGEKISIGL